MKSSQSMTKEEASAFLASDINFPRPITKADTYMFKTYLISVLNLSDHSKNKTFVVETNNNTSNFEAGYIISNELSELIGDNMDCYLEDSDGHLDRPIYDFACTSEPAYAKGGVKGLAEDNELVMVTATIISSRHLGFDAYEVEKERIDNEIKALCQKIIDALSIKYETPTKMVAFLVKNLHHRPSAGRDACVIINQYLEASN